MNVAILQPVVDERAKRSPYRDDVAALGAALRDRGHNVTLAILDGCDEPALAAATAASPEIIFIYVDSLAADLAFRIAGALAVSGGAPLVPFGPHATLRPDECLSMTGAEAVAVGPADVTAADYLASRRSSLDYLRTPGFWVKCETGVMRNPPPRPPGSLLDRAPPARDLYPFETIVDLAGCVQIQASRGGDGGPAGAPAPGTAGAAWPTGTAWPVLHRSVDAVLLEMVQVAEDHLDLGNFRVGNDRWTSRPGWLAEFADRYPREIGVPLRTTLHPADVTDAVAAHLARAGCEEARIRIGSGSALIRNDILGISVPAETFQAAFAALRRAGVPSVACVEVGAPYETPASLEQTIEFLTRLVPDRVDATLHFPAPGTPSDRVAQENGWLVPDPAAAILAGKPAVALPRLSADDIITACEAMPYAVLRPRIVPLIRLSRRVTIGKRGTLYELVVKPFLAPPMRRTR